MNKHTRGFTIVELLIVIVVLAILSTISVVAYNGIISRASDTVVKTDLANFARAVELYKAESGTGMLPGSRPAGGSTGRTEIMADIRSGGYVQFRFSGVGSYGSMNNVDPHATLIYYDTETPFSMVVSYICVAYMSRSGTPFYWSTTKGLYQPAMSGTIANSYNFVQNCQDPAHNQSPVYGRLQVESYL